MTTISSRGFGKITGIGTINPDNRISPKPTRSRRVEVAVSQNYRNTPISVEVFVPVQRSAKGSRRIAALNLNGSQARTLYNTLRVFFEDTNMNTQAWERPLNGNIDSEEIE